MATAALICGASGVSHAQIPAITSSNYQDSCSHFSGGNRLMSYTIISATPSTYVNCSLETNYGDGTKMDTTGFLFSGTPGSYYTNTWHLYSVAGTYSVKKVLIYGGARVDSVNASINVACSIIGGALYHDVNANCVYNTATDKLIRAAFQIKVDSAGIPVDTISARGYWRYAIRAVTATTYTFTLLNSPGGFVASCPSSGVQSYSYLPSSLPPLNKDFGFNCSATPAYDYSLNYSRALRGSSSPGVSFIRLMAANSSCHSGTGTVTLLVSPKYSINTSGIIPTPASVVGQTVTWTLANMANGVDSMLYVPLTPLSSTSNGDTACNYAIITPTTGDVNLANNTVAVCDSVRASWDPNEKSVSPIGPVSSGTLLTYTIDFENLGNDTAFNIHVQDTLSTYLDANTFTIISSSHNVISYLYELSPTTRIIKFDFPNIKLEDKTVPARNKGQVVFSIKMKDGLANGTVVANRAGIYFDGNPVVLTNTAYSRIPVPAAVNTPGQTSGILIYPNPVTRDISIRVQQEGWTEAILSNALGQVLSRMPIHPGVNTLEVQNLPTGIYYLQAKGDAGSVIQKIEKR